MTTRSILVLALSLAATCCQAATYEVGDGAGQLGSIGAVPWASLNAGDTVLIHWRAQSYKEKWVIARQGTELSPITIRGVPNASGDLPVIDGDGAITVPGVNFWNGQRSVIKFGGSNTPSLRPEHIILENLIIRSAHPSYTYTDENRGEFGQNYASNAASITIEAGRHITIRNCTLTDSGNGLFIAEDGGNTQDILVEGCHLYGNGIFNSIYEHNSYTEATDITFQYNYYGQLRSGALGNNLKDRSAGTVVRYNWIESGNRQLDLVDSDNPALTGNPSYNTTYVYGNILIEPDGAGNRQIIHYGGDSGTEANYRKGTLHLFNNTIVSTRSGRNTLLRMSSNGESCVARNNIIYTTSVGSELELAADDQGSLSIQNNWIMGGYVNSHSASSGSAVTDLGGNLTGSSPGFTDFGSQDFKLAAGSVCLDAGTTTVSAIDREYLKHQGSKARASAGTIDIGAYERLDPGAKRSIRIDVPSGFEATITPSQTPSVSGSSFTFGDLDPYATHLIEITVGGTS